MPYYDPHAQAGTSPWSPASDAFCFVNAAGEVRVQRLDALAEAVQGIPVAPSAEIVHAVESGEDDQAAASLAWWSPC